MKPCLLGALILLLPCACTPPPAPPAPPPLIAAPPPPAASSAPAPTPIVVDTTLVSVASARRPATLVLDGDVTEWGSLLPPSPPPPDASAKAPPDEKRGPPDPDEPLPSGPNPASASSHLALALGNDGVTIAADLGEPAKDGVWFGIGAAPPKVLEIGRFARGGYIRPFDCDFEQIRMMEGEWRKGKANPPEVVAACHALIARHADLVAWHRARFTRLFKLDRDGVHGVSAEGALSPIAGATAVFKAGPHGATAEVALPLTALPRLVEAPAVTLRLVARAATGPKPDVVPAQWVEIPLPEPVTFEPFGDLRNHSALRLQHAERLTGFSYQPGDPLHVESMRYDAKEAESVAALQEKLYDKPLARLGDLEIGYVSAYRTWLAVFKNGKFLKDATPPECDDDVDNIMAVDSFTPREPRGVVKRDGELHVFAYGPMSMAERSGAIRWPSWSVVAIAADGSVRNPVEDAHVPMMSGGETTGSLSPDHASFGVRGPGEDHDDRTGHQLIVGLEVTWRWDPVKKLYVGKHRHYPLPPEPKEIGSSRPVKK